MDGIDWGWDSSALRRRVCTLIVTRDCNLNCRYCYEEFKGPENMDFDTARRILEEEYAFACESSDYDGFLIDFMGGEPLLNFPLIREVVGWAKARERRKPITCFAATNGTLLDSEKTDWFRKHRKSVVLGASYDGALGAQRSNRGTDPGAVPLEFFRECWPFQPVRMTVSKATVGTFADGALELFRGGYPVEAVAAQGEDWDASDAELFKKGLRKLKDAFLEDETLPAIRLLRGRLLFGSEPGNMYCGTGRNMAAYDVDGRRYACHMFAPIVQGERALPLDHRLAPGEYDARDPFCDGCALYRICSTCVGVNYKHRGGTRLRDHRFCGMILARCVVACEYQLALLARHGGGLNAEGALRAKEVLEAARVLARLRGNAPYRTDG
ncbi:MAG: 4Fe-4S cluster-binding domain-containing protein [Clostridiales bacterium]|jgi:uncharacterized protein|nr:4Fe-4S cluster-binding domain-containing protein [Clostridiales bacterium]